MRIIRQLRLFSGLVLFAYVTLHLLNLSLGLAGLAVMGAVGDLAGEIIGTPPVSALLYGALTLHVVLAFRALFLRRRLRMRWSEALRLVMGFAIPLLLALHVISIRGGEAMFGADYDYRLIQTYFWGVAPMVMFQQIAGLLAAWVHGCLGLYFWLRLKPGFDAWRGPLSAGALVLPVAALSGFVASGREVWLRIASEPGWFEASFTPIAELSQTDLDALITLTNRFMLWFVAAIALTFVARALWLRWQARAGRYRVTYADGRVISATVGASVLDASRENGVPHASVCGGRGRCSTCRVRLEAGVETLDPPGEEEARVLARVAAGDDVRLACQARPRGDITVTQLMPADAAPRAARRSAGLREGDERLMAILFADLRGFTTLTEQKLPYDVVFLLNRFAREMGEAVERHGGRVDKFMGDGVMALFGLEGTPQHAARAALDAADEMQTRLTQINADMAADLPAPLRMGVGIHAGRVIVGEIGHGPAAGVTAVGDVVNTASRLEALTKDFKAKLVVSKDLMDLSCQPTDTARSHQIDVRGRLEPVTIYVFGNIDES